MALRRRSALPRLAALSGFGALRCPPGRATPKRFGMKLKK
ncbi:hypothetical protein PATSB16_34260 [Pandoraea thiooxydans]|nr:hypothetical protein PATSB16_34260 [Pandoraea thiooxydans]